MNSQKQIIDFFGVSDLRQLPGNDKFKELCPSGSLSFFVDTDDKGRPILWFENDNGHEGFVLADGLLNHWRSRSIHYLDGANSLKQRHKDLRNIVRIGSKLRSEMVEMLQRILPKLSQLQDESAFTLPKKVEELINKATAK